MASAKKAESASPESEPKSGADLGAVAYTAYSEAVGGKSVGGTKLPAWEDQKDEIQDAWIVATQAVLTALFGRKD